MNCPLSLVNPLLGTVLKYSRMVQFLRKRKGKNEKTTRAGSADNPLGTFVYDQFFTFLLAGFSWKPYCHLWTASHQSNPWCQPKLFARRNLWFPDPNRTGRKTSLSHHASNGGPQFPLYLHLILFPAHQSSRTEAESTLEMASFPCSVCRNFRSLRKFYPKFPNKPVSSSLS